MKLWQKRKICLNRNYNNIIKNTRKFEINEIYLNTLIPAELNIYY